MGDLLGSPRVAPFLPLKLASILPNAPHFPSNCTLVGFHACVRGLSLSLFLSFLSLLLSISSSPSLPSPLSSLFRLSLSLLSFLSQLSHQFISSERNLLLLSLHALEINQKNLKNSSKIHPKNSQKIKKNRALFTKALLSLSSCSFLSQLSHQFIKIPKNR